MKSEIPPEKENESEASQNFSVLRQYSHNHTKNYSSTVEMTSPVVNDKNQTTEDKVPFLTRAFTMFYKPQNDDEDASFTRTESFFVAKQFDNLKQFVRGLDAEAETHGFSFFECVKCMFNFI